MARAGLTRDRVVDLALDLVDEGGIRGFDDLTLAAVAARAGVAAPSLYKHVGSLDDLRRGIALRCLAELRESLVDGSLGLAGLDALRALAGAYRTFAKQHPGRYIATQVRYAQTATHDDAALQRAAHGVVEVVTAVLAGYSIPAARTVDTLRVIRSGLHGFVSLELTGGFGLPEDVDESFDVLVATLDAGIRATAWTGDTRAGPTRRPGRPDREQAW